MRNFALDKIDEAYEIFDRALFRVNTSIPGIIQSFDPDTQTVTVKPAIKMRTMVDDEEAFVELPEIDQVPIYFPFAAVAGFALTLPVKPGDPCILLFSQRCIDNWHKYGGIQPPEEAVGSRHHDLSDAFALVCAPSLDTVLEGWCSNGIEIRNRTRTTRITITDTGIDIVTDSSIRTAGNWEHEGTFRTSDHLEVGAGVSGVFIAGNKVVTVMNGIIVGIS